MMRILIVGAGGTGGYFGARLAEHGRDVTFLVRARRAAQLAAQGLVVTSAKGDVRIAAPQTVTADALAGPFDLVILACKAYGLEQAITDMAPAVGPGTAILPLLNGMRQLDLLDARFGAAHVLGGRCMIAAMLDAAGTVRHLNETHGLTFGERDGSNSVRIAAITAALSGCGFDAQASHAIVQDMWDKWVFLATLAGITCLMRASIGAINAVPGGREAALDLFAACCAIAAHNGHALGERMLNHARGILTEAGSGLTASMMRDLEHGHPIEADHVLGDLLARAAPEQRAHSLLALAYARLKIYEAERAAH